MAQLQHMPPQLWHRAAADRAAVHAHAGAVDTAAGDLEKKRTVVAAERHTGLLRLTGAAAEQHLLHGIGMWIGGRSWSVSEAVHELGSPMAEAHCMGSWPVCCKCEAHRAWQQSVHCGQGLFGQQGWGQRPLESALAGPVLPGHRPLPGYQ